jgi:TPR repeat protein
MKTTRCGFVFGLFLLFGVFLLQATDSTNTLSSIQESWQTISNRWSSIPLEKIKQAAETNEVTAQYYLAIEYSNGDGVSKDEVAAFKWMKLAAEQGMAKAQRKLGGMYEKGDGVPEDFLESIKWYQKAAEQGEPFAGKKLAAIYAQGAYGDGAVNGQGAETQIRSGGVAPNHELAEKWMRQAVDLNSAEGQCQFGDLLHDEFDNEGHQDTSRFSDAAEWYRKAAEQGLAKAQYNLAEMYNSGQLGDDQRSNCIPWYLKAAAQGNAEAQAEVGKLHEYYPQSELLKSVNPIDSLKQAAEQGDLSAQFDLAHRYHAGDGVPKDAAEAFKWMEKAAQHEISPVTLTIDAHYYLGVMYETGDGVAKDLTNAFKLYQEAAVGGNKPEPFVRLGQMYEKGEAVPQNDSLAATNYFVATQFGYFPTSDDTARCTAIESLFNLYVQGRGLPADKVVVGEQLNEIKQSPVTTANGQLLLGEIYFQGRFVPQDLVEAAAWIRLAANQNFDDAHNKLDQVEFVMSSTQKEAAKSRFDDLDKRIEQAKISYKQLENFRRGKSW